MVDTPKQILHKLQELGLEEKEAKVYIAIAELGQTTASRIARYLKLKRTTVYNLTPSLLEKQLIEKSLIRNVSYFNISSLKRLSSLAEERVVLAKETEQALEEIKSIRPSKSSVFVAEGVESLQRIYSELVENTSKNTCLYAYYHTSGKRKSPPSDILLKQTQARISKKIPLKLICDANTNIPSFTHNSSESYREIKYLSQVHGTADGETIISDNEIIHISYTDDFLCTIIKNKDIVAM